MNRDLAFGCAGLAVTVAYYLSAAAIPQSDLADTVGPQGLPRIYAYLLGGLSLALIVSSLRSRGSGFGARDSKSLFRPAGIIVIGALYIAVVPWAGYLLSLAALIAITTYYQGGGLGGRTMLVAVSGAVVFWLLFVLLLGIEHPPGIWPELFS